MEKSNSPSWIKSLTHDNLDNKWEYPNYIVFQQLLDTRGWNSSLVNKFLKIPDLTAPNPHNNSQKMRLYLLERVYKIEQTKAFKIEVLNSATEITDFKIKKLIQMQTIRDNKILHKKIKNRNNAMRRLKSKNITTQEINKLQDLGLI